MNKNGTVACLALAVGLSGCKVEISSSPNGTVNSASGLYSCTDTSPCQIDVSDFFFDETFIPIAKSGYAFAGWKPGLCGNSSTNCRLNTKPLSAVDGMDSILASDDVYYLTPDFSPHNREGYSGGWGGFVMKNNNTSFTAEDSVAVNIAISGSAIELTEERFYERIACEYAGGFDRAAASGRRAVESISGTFQCNTIPFRRGTFSGTLQRATRHTLVADIAATDNDGVKYNTAYALTVKYFPMNGEAPLKGEAAIPKARPFTEAHLGEYSGGMAVDSSNCNAPDEAISTFPTSYTYTITREAGLLEITNDAFLTASCVYSQTQEGNLSGSYQCTDFSEGTWSGKLQTHTTTTGSIFSMQLNTKEPNCQKKIEFIGAKGSRISSPLEDDLRTPISSITGSGR